MVPSDAPELTRQDETAPPPAAASSAPAATEITPERPPRWIPWVDVLLVLALFLAALPLRWEGTRGDFWLDEADYARAAALGVQANRWDLAENPGDPDKIVRLRHYHPPGVAFAIQAGMRFGTEDRVLRLPFVAAGAATVSLVYLAGLSLFSLAPTRRRDDPGPSAPAPPRPSKWTHVTPRAIAVLCAAVLIISPAHVRASSHALPWAFITLWLVGLFWAFLRYGESRKPVWLAVLGLLMALLYATSEYFLVTVLALICAAPFLLWPVVREKALRLPTLLGLAAALVVFFAVAWTAWPAGLSGGTMKMLNHYVEMADDPWPVKLNGVSYQRAPKWAYAHWYWHLYRPYFVWYVLGGAAFLWLALTRRLRPGQWAAATLTGVVMLAAHKSHIIGPEYLSHALPLLTLWGGLFFAAVAGIRAAPGLLAAVVATALVFLYRPPEDLSGMHARSRHPRWEAAARFIARRWRPNDSALVPPFGAVGTWYLRHRAGIPAEDWQVQSWPPRQATPRMIEDVRSGVYRWVVVGNTFQDYPFMDNTLRQIIAKWPVVYRSDEGGTGPSRLVVYERPRGVSRLAPLPLPGAPARLRPETVPGGIGVAATRL
jgi:hypothetical protein